MVADTATAALVAADGAVDWWCPGALDAPPAFAGLVAAGGGSLRIAPVGVEDAGAQQYDERTMLLRTLLPGPESEIEILDLLPWDGGTPAGRLVRVVTARRGPVDVEVTVEPGSDFHPATHVSQFSEGIAFDGLVIRTGFPLDGRRGVVRLDAGERIVVTVDDPREHQPLSVDRTLLLAEQSAEAWRRELAELSYGGPWAGLVARCLLSLRALGTAAAVTTSLPGDEGGERNVDHRLAWVRHVAAAVPLLARLGLAERADALGTWVADVLDEHGLPVPGVLALNGGRPAAEREVPGPSGWRRSQPVRVGNIAGDHLHLDHLVDVVAADHWVRRAVRFRELAGWLSDEWGRPDHGAWDVRSGPRRFVSSALSSHAALRTMARWAQEANPLDLEALAWSQTAEEIEAWIDEHLGDPPLDAALLRLAWTGLWPPGDRRVVRTVDRVLDGLGTGPFVHRLAPSFDDGFPSGGGASVEASCWAVRALAATGRWEEAHDRFEQLVGVVGPLGLVPELVEPLSSDFLGDLPHAGATIALLEAAIALADGPR